MGPPNALFRVCRPHFYDLGNVWYSQARCPCRSKTDFQNTLQHLKAHRSTGSFRVFGPKMQIPLLWCVWECGMCNLDFLLKNAGPQDRDEPRSRDCLRRRRGKRIESSTNSVSGGRDVPRFHLAGILIPCLPCKRKSISAADSALAAPGYTPRAPALSPVRAAGINC
jgi:hypothetical protein